MNKRFLILLLAVMAFAAGCSALENIAAPDPEEILGLTKGIQPDYSVAPDDSSVAVAAEQNGVISIHAASLDGSGSRKLTSPGKGEDHIQPVFSPDGSKIAFVSVNDDRTTARLMMMNRDGSGLKPLTKPEKNRSHIRPAFSPDGKKILFISANPDRSRSPLMIINADGTGLEQLTPDTSMVQEAVFSPDGKTVYFVEAKQFVPYYKVMIAMAGIPGPVKLDLFAMDLASKKVTQLTRFRSPFHFDLSVTGDGKELHFINTGEDADRYYALSLKPPYKLSKPGEKNPVPEAYGLAVSPRKAWSAIVIARPQSGCYTYELALLDRNTNRLTQLTSLGKEVSEPKFLHRGDRLVFLENVAWKKQCEQDPYVVPTEYRMWTVGADGKGLREVRVEEK